MRLDSNYLINLFLLPNTQIDEDSTSKWKLDHYPVSKADVFIVQSQQTVTDR